MTEWEEKAKIQKKKLCIFDYLFSCLWELNRTNAGTFLSCFKDANCM